MTNKEKNTNRHRMMQTNRHLAVKDAVFEFQRQQMEGANIVPARIANGHVKTKMLYSLSGRDLDVALHLRRL